MSDTATFNREMNAIKFARQKKKGIHDCMIVTWEDEGEIDGIRIIPVWKWLLT
jgi:predicted AAA+ superfamily ATPase